MFQHLRYKGASVEPHSQAGEHTKNLLMLNDEESLQYREFVLGVIAISEEKKRSVSETLIRIDAKLSTNPDSAEELEREREKCIEQLKEIDDYLARLTGGGS
jgi:hypothetical protein